MTADEVKALIGKGKKATEAIADYAAVFEEERHENHCDGFQDVDINEATSSLLASFIANAIRWKQDRWGHVTRERLPGDEWFLPSQIRIKVINELQTLSLFLTGPDDVRRTKRRISISMYAVDALRKRGAL